MQEAEEWVCSSNPFKIIVVSLRKRVRFRQ